MAVGMSSELAFGEDSGCYQKWESAESRRNATPGCISCNALFLQGLFESPGRTLYMQSSRSFPSHPAIAHVYDGTAERLIENRRVSYCLSAYNMLYL